MASRHHEPSLTITADEARRLVPSLRQAYRALASISAMHQGTGLKRQALETSMAARRLLLLCGDLDALTREPQGQFAPRSPVSLLTPPAPSDTGSGERSAGTPGAGTCSSVGRAAS